MAIRDRRRVRKSEAQESPLKGSCPTTICFVGGEDVSASQCGVRPVLSVIRLELHGARGGV